MLPGPSTIVPLWFRHVLVVGISILEPEELQLAGPGREGKVPHPRSTAQGTRR